MPPPVFVVCEICGKKFSKRSLGIHQKQCLKKAESSMVSALVAANVVVRLPRCGSLATVQPACTPSCPPPQTHCTICGLPVSKDEYSAHVDDCKRHNPEMARAAAKGKGKAAPLTSVVPLHVKKRIESGGAATGPPVRQSCVYACARFLCVCARACMEGRSSVHGGLAPLLRVVVLRPCRANGPVTFGRERRPGVARRCDLGSVSLCVVEAFPQSALDMPTKAVHNMEIPAFVPEDGDEEDGRVACRVCERKFKRDRIAKHQLICAKVSKKEIIRKRKMKVVSGEELRLRGTDFEKYKDSRTDVSSISG